MHPSVLFDDKTHRQIKIVVLEHDPNDLDLILYELNKSGLPHEVKIVVNEVGFRQALLEFHPDIILSDYCLPGFEGIEAFKIRQELVAHIPFIFVSGNNIVENSIELIKNGLTDYVLKDKLFTLTFKLSRALKAADEIKNKKEAEEALRKSEFRLNEAQAIAKIGSWEKDIMANEFTWSKYLYQIFGLPKEKEPSKENYYAVIHPDDRDFVSKIISDSERNGHDITYEHRVLRPDGTIGYVFCESKNVLNAEGQIIRRYGIVHDITAKRQEEQQKEFEANNLKALINNTKDLMWSVNRDFRLITSNQTFETMVKWMCGKTVFKDADVLDLGFSEEQNLRYKGLYERAFSGETFTVEEHTYIPDEYWSEISFYPIYQGEVIVGTACYARDITQKRKAEQQLQKSEVFNQGVLNSLNSNIAVVNPEGAIVAVNNSWHKFATENGGTLLAKTMIENNYFEVCKKSAEDGVASASQVLQGMKEVIEGKREVFYMEYPCHAPDQKRWFGLRVTKFESDEPLIVVAHQDITERKLGEVSLIQSGKRLQEAQGIAHVGNWEVNFASGVSIWSDETCRIYGLPETENIQSHASWISFIYPDDLDDVMASVKESEKTLSENVLNYRIILRDGGVKHIYSKSKYEFNTDGKLIGLYGITHDVTDIKLAEHAVVQSNERYALATKATNDILWDWDIITGKIYRSDNYKEQFGYATASGHADDDTWLGNIHLEDKERVIQSLQGSLENPEILIWECEYRFYDSAGSMLYIKDNGHIVRDDKGKATRMVGGMSDITEQKISEERLLIKHKRLKQAQAIAHLGNWEINFTNNMSLWSKEASKIYGIHSDEEQMSVAKWMKYIHKDDRQEVVTKMKNTLDNHLDFSCSHRIVRADGTERYVNSECKYEFNNEGVPIGIYGIVHDVTEQKQAELQLQDLLNTTREQNKRLQNFAYIVSHNIRSHTANIIGLVDVLKDAGNDDDRVVFINMLKTSTDKLGETIDNLNNIITMQNDKSREKIEVNLRTEVDKTCNAINALISSTKTIVMNQIPKEMVIQTVPAYLESILLNLLSNSIKYRSPMRNCVISISAEQEGGHLELSVADNGIGIDMDKNGVKLFGMYKTFHHNEDARGLGLFITKNQVEALNGRIEAESTVDVGSIFRIYL